MKIRHGFVSNSSSSSFILIGNSIDIKDLLETRDTKNIYAISEDYLSEGFDVFRVTSGMLDAIDSYGSAETIDADLTFIKTDKYIDDVWGSVQIHKKNLPDEFEIFSGDADYNNTKSVDKFIERYLTK